MDALEELDPLTGSQRKYLRGLAHHLQPLVSIGRAGLTDGLLESLAEALDHHELVKVKFLDHKRRKRDFCEAIEEHLACHCAGTIGHVAIFYRPAADREQRRIELPA